MKIFQLLCTLLFLCSNILFAQSDEYTKKKNDKIKSGSVFTKIINGELPAEIVYEDKVIVAFVPLRKQAPVHLLIVPKKEIYTINDLEDGDEFVMGKMFLVAKHLAEKFNIAESGYRLSVNTNEDAGQSVFHLHMHLLGGKVLGPMMDQSD